ncbi:hypothetical protein, partial [Cupriavidus sp. AcVe19-6a]|uniref:hypothetical protein n=1 Tax=Cupriavidus sp. AcVe19-6a TaxID=2821358 RepID=UPI001AE68D43
LGQRQPMTLAQLLGGQGRAKVSVMLADQVKRCGLTITACSGTRSISSWIMFASAKSLRTLACQRSAFNTRRRLLSAYIYVAKATPIFVIDLSRERINKSLVLRQICHICDKLNVL